VVAPGIEPGPLEAVTFINLRYKKIISSYEKHTTPTLCHIPVWILVDSPRAKVSTIVARSLAAEDEIADKSVCESRNAWTTTESSPAGVDEDWHSPVTATIASARATDRTLSAIASAACYNTQSTKCKIISRDWCLLGCHVACVPTFPRRLPLTAVRTSELSYL
jgi:hypothetical protein